MSENKKSPLKRFELPMNRFANVALPLYLDMLDKQQRNLSKVCYYCYLYQNCAAQLLILFIVINSDLVAKKSTVGGNED